MKLKYSNMNFLIGQLILVFPVFLDDYNCYIETLKDRPMGRAGFLASVTLDNS
jgi:hypothetical protein